MHRPSAIWNAGRTARNLLLEQWSSPCSRMRPRWIRRECDLEQVLELEAIGSSEVQDEDSRATVRFKFERARFAQEMVLVFSKRNTDENLVVVAGAGGRALGDGDVRRSPG